MRTVGLKQMRTHGLKNADMVLKKFVLCPEREDIAIYILSLRNVIHFF